MGITHHRAAWQPIGSASRPSGGDRQGGYVMAKFALLLVPLLLMTGLSVDVGYWYNRVADIQKAADAAALAGVVWLPDTIKARTYATEAAARNGFVDGQSNISVTVVPVPGNTRQLRVTIRDRAVGSFLWQGLAGRTLDMSRSATAEYVLPVALGSPLAQFGDNGETGNDRSLGNGQTTAAGGAFPMNLWANIHGPNNNKTEGDAFATACNGGKNCLNNPTNTEYRPSGYLYTVDVGPGVSNMDVLVYDAGFYHRPNETTETGDTSKEAADTRLRYTFYNRDSTELDVSDNPTAVASGACTSGEGTWDLQQGEQENRFRMKWASLCRISGTVPQGRYLLRIESYGRGAGLSRYAVRVTSTSATKPRLSAYGDMSVFNQLARGTSQFFLTEVTPVHAGKTLQIRLYDPGETSSGNAYMRLMMPTRVGGSMQLRIASSCGATHDGGTLSGRFVSPTNLSPCQVQTSRNGALFNGLWITLNIPIPANYTCVEGEVNPGCWWKIEYEVTAQTVDNTTWSASVVGDPVHLIHEEA